MVSNNPRSESASSSLSDCDIIMKGGITSGVVYPKALLRLATRFRFRCIGGTSAGAIAASVLAAAEYGRGQGGFGHLATVPDFISQNMTSLFQPDSRAAALFTVFKDGYLEHRWGKAVAAVARQHWLLSLLLVAALAGAVAALVGGEPAWGLALTLLVPVLFAGIVLAFLRRAWQMIPKVDFGVCPGPRQPGYTEAGLSDWLAETIERCAGRWQEGGTPPERPLTFGHLANRGDGPSISLRMMTTNLSMRRPHALPNLGERNYYFKEEEFRRLFPGWVVDAMVRDRTPENGVFPFPGADDLPVVVAARMSLSFPLLISAVPLYRYDYDSAAKPLRRLLFSDGGLSSNFPIHFFDAILPGRPTFGISLDDLNPDKPNRRVHLSPRPQWLDIKEIKTIPGFLMALLNAAKDWQDLLQGSLPGYRDRVVHIALDPDKEGGLNLTMDATKIKLLLGLGERASGLLEGAALPGEADKEPFDFDNHRWGRFLVAFGAVEEALDAAAEAWGDPADAASFAHFVKHYMEDPRSYAGSSKAWRRDVFDRFDALMTTGNEWSKTPLRHAPGAIPKSRAALRIVYDLDREP